MAKAKTISEPKLRTFRVSLPFQPTTDVQATNETDAKLAYNQANGIISTDQQYIVADLTTAEPVEESKPLETITS